MKRNAETPRGLDLMPALFLVLALFIAGGALEFSGSWSAAQRGLLIFERECPLREVAPARGLDHRSRTNDALSIRTEIQIAA